MFSSSRFNLDDFCIVYKSNNLNTNVYKKPNIYLSQTPTQLQSQIIAVTILNIPSGVDHTSSEHGISWYLYSGCDCVCRAHKAQPTRPRLWKDGVMYDLWCRCCRRGKSGDISKRTNFLHLLPRFRMVSWSESVTVSIMSFPR
jgi:hypothetical protein